MSNVSVPKFLYQILSAFIAVAFIMTQTFVLQTIATVMT